jgi:membrane-associated phospholipid phosphatase
MAGFGAVAGFALLIATWYAAFHIWVVEQADRSLYRGFGELGTRPPISSLANSIAELCDPKPYVFLGAVAVLVAVARRRPLLAVAIGLILLGANETTQLLKPLLVHPRAASLFGDPGPASSWPSGHATAAMSLALCGVLATPSRVRPFVSAAGAAFAVAVAYSVIALGSHYPSDVIGGFLVAGIWTLLAAAAVLLATSRRRHPEATAARPRPFALRRALGPPLGAVVIAIALVGVFALMRPGKVVGYVQLHEGLVVGATAIGFVGLMLCTYLTLALRR